MCLPSLLFIAYVLGLCLTAAKVHCPQADGARDVIHSGATDSEGVLAPTLRVSFVSRVACQRIYKPSFYAYLGSAWKLQHNHVWQQA
jgi:hypothetical protein